jgi:hypothetical protein
MTEDEAVELSIIERRRLVLLSKHPVHENTLSLGWEDRQGVETCFEFMLTLRRRFLPELSLEPSREQQ